MTGLDMMAKGYAKRQDELCRSCKAAITWWVTPLARIAPYNRVEAMTDEVVSHFATCAQAKEWRKKKP